jgi:hypothetical protein
LCKTGIYLAIYEKYFLAFCVCVCVRVRVRVSYFKLELETSFAKKEKIEIIQHCECVKL